MKDPDSTPKSVYKGIDFLGYFIKPRYTLIRRRVLRNMQMSFKKLLPQPPKIKEPYLYTFGHRSVLEWQNFQACMNSYLAHFAKANSYNLFKNIEKNSLPYKANFKIADGYIRLCPRRPDRFFSFSQQLRYLLALEKSEILIIRMGKFYELYGKYSESIGTTLKLKPYWRNGFLKTYGILYRKLSRLVAHIKKIGLNGTIIEQGKELTEFVIVRLPVFSWHRITPIQLEFFKPELF